MRSRRGIIILALVLFQPRASLRAQGNGGAVPTKISRTSAPINDEFSLTVEIPGGCDIPSVDSDDFSKVASRDFKQEAPAPREYPHLQPTGHVRDVISDSPGGFSGGFPAAIQAPKAETPASVLRTYILKAKHAGDLTVGPFHVLCPGGPLETQPQSIQISDDESVAGKVIAIQDLSQTRRDAADAAPAPAAVPAAPGLRTPLFAAHPAPPPAGLVEQLQDVLTGTNLLILSLVGVGTTVFLLLLRAPGRKKP